MVRIDIKHDIAHDHVDIDVTISSVSTTNAREALRRQIASEPALRAVIDDKVKTYGSVVQAAALDHTEAISGEALRLLRGLASAAVGDEERPEVLQQ